MFETQTNSAALALYIPVEKIYSFSKRFLLILPDSCTCQSTDALIDRMEHDSVVAFYGLRNEDILTSSVVRVSSDAIRYLDNILWEVGSPDTRATTSTIRKMCFYCDLPASVSLFIFLTSGEKCFSCCNFRVNHSSQKQKNLRGDSESRRPTLIVSASIRRTLLISA